MNDNVSFEITIPLSRPEHNPFPSHQKLHRLSAISTNININITSHFQSIFSQEHEITHQFLFVSFEQVFQNESRSEFRNHHCKISPHPHRYTTNSLQAIGQLCSTADIQQNLLTCQKLAKEASEQGAKVCFYLSFAPSIRS